MSSGHGGSSALQDLKWLIIILAIMWAVWYFTSGTGKSNSNQTFIQPGTAVDTSSAYSPTFIDPKQP